MNVGTISIKTDKPIEKLSKKFLNHKNVKMFGKKYRVVQYSLNIRGIEREYQYVLREVKKV